jgi:hypothetical protein
MEKEILVQIMQVFKRRSTHEAEGMLEYSGVAAEITSNPCGRVAHE